MLYLGLERFSFALSKERGKEEKGEGECREEVETDVKSKCLFIFGLHRGTRETTGSLSGLGMYPFGRAPA